MFLCTIKINYYGNRWGLKNEGNSNIEAVIVKNIRIWKCIEEVFHKIIGYKWVFKFY